MDPAEIRVIRRLSNRVNVLPIIARSDILTDEKLTAVKNAVRHDLAEAKLGFGVFGPAKVDEPSSSSDVASIPSTGEHGTGSIKEGSIEGGTNGKTNGNGNGQWVSREWLLGEHVHLIVIKLFQTIRLL